MRNPFFIEKARRELARTNRDKLLLKFYSGKLPLIKDKNTGHFWDKKFENTVSYFDEDGMTKDRVKIAASFIPNKKVKILDIGAGMGLIEQYLKIINKNYEIYGIDISQISVNFLNKHFNGKFKKGSLYNMNFKENSFDAVLALEVLEHVPPFKIIGVLKNIKKILKPRGIFIGSVPLNEKVWGIKNNENSHLREYSLELIKKELDFSGFKLLDYKKIYAFPNSYLFKNFLAKNVLTKRWDPNDLIFKARKI